MEARISEIESGATFRVPASDWTRFLAAGAVRAGGEFSSAASMIDASGWGNVLRETFSDVYASAIDSDGAGIALDASGRWESAAVDVVRNAPGYAGLASSVRGDEWLAGVVSGKILRSVGEEIEAIVPKSNVDKARDAVADASTDAERAEAEKALEKALAESATAAEKVRSGSAAAAAARAVDVAAEMVQSDRAFRGLLGDDSVGVGETFVPPAVRCAAMMNPDIIRIVKLAGAMRRSARAVRASKRVDGGAGEIVSTEIGSDVARLVPSELAYLADEETADLLFARIVESRATIYATRGVELGERGPVIVLVDESGSMTDERRTWASAVAMAIASLAMAERREVVLVPFSGPGQTARYDLRPRGRDNAARLEAFSRGHFNGGTSPSHAIVVANRAIAESTRLKGAEIILVTDGQPSHGDVRYCEAQLDRAKSNGTTFRTIAIGSERVHDVFERFSASVERISDEDIQKGAMPDALVTL